MWAGRTFGVTLLAVLVGALLPVLYQVMQTLRDTRRVLTVVESHTKELKPAIKAAAEIGESVRTVNNSLKSTANLASALAPHLLSLVRSLRGEVGESQKKPSSEVAGSVAPTVTDGVGEEEKHHGI